MPWKDPACHKEFKIEPILYERQGYGPRDRKLTMPVIIPHIVVASVHIIARWTSELEAGDGAPACASGLVGHHILFLFMQLIQIWLHHTGLGPARQHKRLSLLKSKRVCRRMIENSNEPLGRMSSLPTPSIWCFLELRCFLPHGLYTHAPPLSVRAAAYDRVSLDLRSNLRSHPRQFFPRVIEPFKLTLPWFDKRWLRAYVVTQRLVSVFRCDSWLIYRGANFSTVMLSKSVAENHDGAEAIADILNVPA
ncbi:hypothetical protein K474DRAFT_1676126 [Panus rudis PR-1116 ss-1]|nr:hypothetical protein K474DRAFT_1676126 [Panus rudis PR-1116 ss-1]